MIHAIATTLLLATAQQSVAPTLWVSTSRHFDSDDQLESAIRDFETLVAAGTLNPSLEEAEKLHDFLLQIHERLDSMPRPTDESFYDFAVLRNQVDEALVAFEYRTYLRPLDHGLDVLDFIRQLTDPSRYHSPNDFRTYLDRLATIPAAVDALQRRLQRGIEEGNASHTTVVQDALQDLRTYLDSDTRSLERPFAARWKETPAIRTSEYWGRFAATAPLVIHSLEALERYLRTDYLPHARTDPSVKALPDGIALYRDRLNVIVGPDSDPNDLHSLGVEEVDRLRKNIVQLAQDDDIVMNAIGKDLPAEQVFSSLVAYMRDSNRFYDMDENAILRDYRSICQEATGNLSLLFSVLPQTPCAILLDHSFTECVPVRYSPGSLRDGYSALLLLNMTRPQIHPTWIRRPLICHEIAPGHHIERGIAIESSLSTMRRDWVSSIAAEGWAMYSEDLALEMKLYSDSWEELGFLFSQLWRAARMVCDTGVHSKDWSLDDATRFLEDNVPLQACVLHADIDRLVRDPGQLCSYTTGHRLFARLRNEAESRLEEQFDIREFHDMLLSAASLPPTALEHLVADWIEAQLITHK